MVCVQNPPNSRVVWGRGQVFTSKIWGEGHKVCGFLLTGDEVTGRRSTNLVHSLELPHPPGWMPLVPAEKLKDTVLYILPREIRNLSYGCSMVS